MKKYTLLDFKLDLLSIWHSTNDKQISLFDFKTLLFEHLSQTDVFDMHSSQSKIVHGILSLNKGLVGYN